MSTQTLLQIASMLVTLIVGIAGGIIGAYVGMKIGIAKLETWREIFAQALHDAQGNITLLNEDSATHDTELGFVMDHLKMPRTRRQRFRD